MKDRVASLHMRHLRRIRWDAMPGTVSVWCGPVRGPASFARAEHDSHYAASMMKVPVLVALHRKGFHPDEPVAVHNDFASAGPRHGRYGLNPEHDEDDAVWTKLGATATLGWLAEHMITRSSNLAANLVLERVGLERVVLVWRSVGARVSRVGRGIGDTAAAEAGITNTVSAGLPSGTRAAHKNGWVRGVRHAAGVIFPDDAPPFVLAVCATTPLAVNRPGDDACRLIRTVAAAAWQDRHVFAG